MGTPPPTSARGQPRSSRWPSCCGSRAYWLGLTAIDAAVGLFITNRLEFDGLVPKENVGTSLFVIGIGAAIVGIIVQPTVGYISDYTVSKWGRRKPYIVFGSLLDVVFLLGIATGNTVAVLAAFMVLLGFSTNIARGPFQGYVPTSSRSHRSAWPAGSSG